MMVSIVISLVGGGIIHSELLFGALKHGCMIYIYIHICLHIPRESKDQTLPIGSRESFI